MISHIYIKGHNQWLQGSKSYLKANMTKTYILIPYIAAHAYRNFRLKNHHALSLPHYSVDKAKTPEPFWLFSVPYLRNNSAFKPVNSSSKIISWMRLLLSTSTATTLVSLLSFWFMYIGKQREKNTDSTLSFHSHGHLKIRHSLSDQPRQSPTHHIASGKQCFITVPVKSPMCLLCPCPISLSLKATW